MLTLYQMPISHYCEKVRWALDYKGILAKRCNLLPGFHVRTAKKLAPRSQLPILEHDGVVIQGSSDIITHLDAAYPGRLLTPEDEPARREALEWERFADDEIGPHVRRMLYHVLLEHPNLVIPFFTHQGPWYGRFLLPRLYPTLQKRMRALMRIDAETARESQDRVEQALDRLNTHLRGRSFLVGDRFTRADLAAASLLAPLAGPPGYGLPWPESYPPDVQAVIHAFDGKLSWVNRTYAEWR